MWCVTLCVVIALVVVKISLWLYRWSNPNCSGKLPPGSMGFPMIGETVEFFKPYSFDEIPPFVNKRISNYGGSLFRTNILGSKTIVSTDPEVNFEILKQDSKCFIMSYPEALVRIFGRDNLFFKQNKNFHRYMRHIVLQLFGPDCLKQRLIHKIDLATREHLKSDSFQGVLDVKHTIGRLIMEQMIQMIVSDIKSETKSRLIEALKDFSFDLVRSPFDPSFWTALYNGLMARRAAMKMIKRILEERREEATLDRLRYGDFMETMINELEKEGDKLNEDRCVELILSLLIASYETTSTMTAITVKFIAENPKVLTELKREHETILQNRADKECGVTWKEYRSTMSFTHMVINESLRLGSLSPAMFRKAVTDVEINGYTIPAGWIVLVVPSLLHYDPKIYEQPCEFNPWRWEGKELLTGSKTFMAFGGGARLCAGAEFARLQIAIFLHHLVTTYDFSLVERPDITRTPLLQFSKPIRISISENHLRSSHHHSSLF